MAHEGMVCEELGFTECLFSSRSTHRNLIVVEPSGGTPVGRYAQSGARVIMILHSSSYEWEEERGTHCSSSEGAPIFQRGLNC